MALPRHATGLDSGHYMYVRLAHGADGTQGGGAEEEELPFFTRARDAEQWCAGDIGEI